jgi:hypothetical protein
LSIRNWAFSLAFCAFAGPLACAGTYQLDDGSVSANGFGLGLFGPIQSVWLNGFQAQAGMEVINSVSIMFGAAPVGDGLPANGTPLTVVLYTDPNNDGDAIDGVLQRQVAGTVQSADTGTFVDFAIPSITLTPGAWFYVGMAIAAPPNSNVFGPNIDSEDLNDPSIGGPSFLYGWYSGTPDITDLSTSLGSTQPVRTIDFMIRATGVEDTAVPEPGSGLLLGVGFCLLAGLLRRNRTAATR